VHQIKNPQLLAGGFLFGSLGGFDSDPCSIKCESI